MQQHSNFWAQKRERWQESTLRFTCLALNTLPSSQGQSWPRHSLSPLVQSYPNWSLHLFWGRHSVKHTRELIQCKNHLPSVVVSFILEFLNGGWSQHSSHLRPPLRHFFWQQEISWAPSSSTSSSPSSVPLTTSGKLSGWKDPPDPLSPGLFWPRSAHAKPCASHPRFQQGWGLMEGTHSPQELWAGRGALVIGIGQQPPPPPCNTNHRNRKVGAGATHLKMTVALNNASKRCVLLLEIPLSFKTVTRDHRELISKVA